LHPVAAVATTDIQSFPVIAMCLPTALLSFPMSVFGGTGRTRSAVLPNMGADQMPRGSGALCALTTDGIAKEYQVRRCEDNL